MILPYFSVALGILGPAGLFLTLRFMDLIPGILICSLISLVGLILGIISIKTGTRKKLSVIGIIVSSIGMILPILFFMMILWAVSID